MKKSMNSGSRNFFPMPGSERIPTKTRKIIAFENRELHAYA
jgi:hypothetical protein